MVMDIKGGRRALGGLAAALLALALLVAPMVQAETAEEYYESGVSLFAEENLPAAVIQLKNSLQKDPNHLPARVLLGRIHMRQGDTLDAENQLQTALRLGADPDLVMPLLGLAWLYQEKTEEILSDQRYLRFAPRTKAEWQVIRGKVYLLADDYPAAQTEFERALDLHPDEVEAMTGLSYSFLFRGDLEEAARVADAAMLDFGGNDLVLNLQGEIASRRGDEDAALDYYSRAIEADPDNYSARQKRGAILLAREQYAAATEDIDAILERFPNNPNAMVTKAILLSRQNKNREAQLLLEEFNFRLSNIPDSVLEEDVQLQIIRGLTLFMQGSPIQAIPFLRDVYEAYPEKAYIRHMLIDSYFATRGYQEVVDIFRPMELLPQGEMPYTYIYAQSALAAEAGDEAAAKLRLWIDKNPEFARELSQLLAVLLTSTGKHEEALAVIRDIDLEKVENLNSLLLLGTVQLEQGLVDEAATTSETLKRRFPGHPRALNLSCLANKRLDNMEAAKADCKAAIKADPQYIAPVINLSVIQMEEKNYPAAISGFNVVLVVSPANAQALEGMARIAAEQEEWNYAVRFAERLAAFNPGNVPYRHQLAEYYLKAEMIEQALDQLDYIERVDPGNPRTMALRADAGRMAGDDYAAAQQLRSLFDAYRIDNPGALVRIAREQLSLAALDDALVTIEEIMKHADYRVQGLRLKAEYSFLTDDPAACVSLLQRTGSSGDAERLLLARCLAASGKPGDALAELGRMMDADPSEINAVQRFRLHVQIDNPAAVAELQAWLAKHPDSPMAIKSLADNYTLVDPARARIEYEKLRSRWPDFERAAVYNNLANLLLLSGEDTRLALDYAQRAYNADPENAAIADTYGWSLVSEGRYGEGLKYLRQAFVRRSQDAEVAYHLAYTLAKLDRKTEAVKYANELDRSSLSDAQWQHLQEAVN